MFTLILSAIGVPLYKFTVAEENTGAESIVRKSELTFATFTLTVLVTVLTRKWRFS